MKKTGFLGAGKMATALMRSLLRSGWASSEDIICSDVLSERLQAVHSELGVGVTDANAEVVSSCEMVVLAFKPQNFPEAVAGLASSVREDQLIISILAGVRIAEVREYLPGRVVRVMPNTACLVGEMAAGFSVGAGLTEQDLSCVREFLGCAGLAVEVTEDQLDAVTGLSGSGPAFVAYLVEQFISGGIKAGLDEGAARQLAVKTFAGTARLLSECQMSPSELIRMVSSPGGTTVAGREILESSQVGQVIEQTVMRAAERSRELGG